MNQRARGLRSRAGWVAITVAGVFLWTAAATALRTSVAVWEDPERADTTVGRAVVQAPAVDILSLASNVNRWPHVFSDVQWVRAGTGDAVVQFSSATLQSVLTVKVDRKRSSIIRLELVDGPPGSSGWAEVEVAPGPQPENSVVHARMHLDVNGLPGLGVPDRFLHKKREDKVSRDLVDLQRWFAR